MTKKRPEGIELHVGGWRMGRIKAVARPQRTAGYGAGTMTLLKANQPDGFDSPAAPGQIRSYVGILRNGAKAITRNPHRNEPVDSSQEFGRRP